MNRWTPCLILSLVILVNQARAADSVVVRSPNGEVQLIFAVKAFDGQPACAVYRVTDHGQTVIADSRLGLQLEPKPWGTGLRLIRQTETRHDTTWKPVCGERSVVRNHYHQAVVELKETNAPDRIVDLTFRVYNSGAAFCYTIPKQPGFTRITMTRERTEFRFATDPPAWVTYSAQGPYSEVPLSRIRPGCERPLVIHLQPDLYVALAEARLVDYARMKFAPLPGHPHCLVSDLGSRVKATLPLCTPWRVIMVGDSPGQLLERNDLLPNLNAPCALADTSWIKPGKVLRDVTLSTVGSEACVDFAVKHHLQYVELDAGWYGPQDTGDARRVAVNPNRPQGGLDLPAVIHYAKARGIGIILYVNHGPLEHQLNQLLPLYHSWGVKGVKFGFVRVGSQRWTRWLHDAVRQAAANHLMVDVHDEYRPTGWARTYPNWMTQEGIRGDEERQPNSMSLTSLFTRMLAGAADNTICYFDQRVDQECSHAYQLAKAVCFYSPWQFLYWYDRPFISRAVTGRGPHGYNILGNEPELEFFDHCPTVWDDTRVLCGRIGQYAVIARRHGAEWFLGCMNANQPRTFRLPLAFLTPGRAYVAHLYTDDPTVPTRTHVRVSRYRVQRSTVLNLAVSKQGGAAVWFAPATASEHAPEYP